MRLLTILLAAAITFAASDELFDAARKGDVAVVRALLDKGTPVDATWRYGQTALFIAAGRGHTEVVKLLLERGAKADVKDTFYGMTALAAAADKNHAGIVSMLLDKGATGGDALMTMAASSGKESILKVLLSKQKWPPAVLSSALAAAESNKQPATVELLKAAGAKPREIPRIDPAVLERYTGSYQSPGAEMKVEVKDGKLYLTGFGQSLECVPIDVTTFEPVKYPGAIKIFFITEGERPTGFDLQQGPSKTRFNRAPEAAK